MISVLFKSTTHPGVARFSSVQQTQPSRSQMEYYESLRIHKHKSLLAILNNLAINKAMRYDILVDNGPQLCALTYKLFGKAISNQLINKTVGNVFTAGENLESVKKYIKVQQESAPNVSLILDYCSEAIEGLKDCEQFYDENSEIFKQSVLVCGQANKCNMIAIKISSLIDHELLKKISKTRVDIINIYNEFENLDGPPVELSMLFNKFESLGLQLTQQDKEQFIRDVLKQDINTTTVDRTTWIYRVQPIFMYDIQLNDNKVIKFLNQIDQQEAELFNQFIQRITYFMQPALEQSVPVMVDAEQTYLQQAIDSFSEQMEAQFNKNSIVVLNTVQNYLKSSKHRIDYELEKARMFGTPIGIKMVRGAYMVEESRIANQQKLENPINNGFDATTQMIERNIDQLVQQSKVTPTSLCIASHNELTVEYAQSLISKYGLDNKGSLFFAQLYGLSDHVTYSLAQQGYRIYKYVPFGRTEIMIPYLLRRAQETKKVLQSSQLQSQLLIDELKRRLHVK